MPVLNFHAMWNPDEAEDGAVELNCVQTEAVQQYFLDPKLCCATPGQQAEAESSSAAAAAAPTHEEAAAAAKESSMESAAAAKESPVDSATEEAEPLKSHPIPEQSPPPQPSLELASAEPSRRALSYELLVPSASPPPVQEAPAEPTPPPTEPSMRILQRHTALAAGAAKAAASLPPEPAGAVMDDQIAGVHRKFVAHVSASYRELLKAVKSELHQQQESSAALLREAIAAQIAATQAERDAVLAAERGNMERLLSALSVTLNTELPARLQEAVRAELAGVAAAIGPAVQAAVASSLPSEVGPAVKSSIEKQLGASLQAAVAKPVQDAFRSAFSKQLVPAFEAATQAMFVQIDGSLARGMEQHLQASRVAMAEPAGLAASLRDALASSAALAGALHQQAQELPRAGSLQSVSGLRSPDTRSELRSLASAGRFEEAFSRALGMQDLAIVAWLCSQVDIGSVLSMDPPALTQAVLLSLIQQLAADLTTEVGTKLQWIREAAMQINPADPSVTTHVRPVLGQVHSALASAAPRLKGGEAGECRLALHVVRSQMSG
jgi:hypothetical protein